MTIRVLIVEDVEMMLQLLNQMIAGMEGLRVSGLARNAWEARLELTRRRPNLVFLDEVLPGESSLDLLHDLEKEKIPVILLTSLENPTHELPSRSSVRLLKPAWDTLEEGKIRFQKAIDQVLCQ